MFLRHIRTIVLMLAFTISLLPLESSDLFFSSDSPVIPLPNMCLIKVIILSVISILTTSEQAVSYAGQYL